MRRFVLMAAAVISAVAFYFAPFAFCPNQGPTESVALAAGISAPVQLFATEDDAQKHCTHDTVVWLNTTTGIYHLKGERWYGRTKHGAYVCKKEADAAGYRETENGHK